MLVLQRTDEDQPMLEHTMESSNTLSNTPWQERTLVNAGTGIEASISDRLVVISHPRASRVRCPRHPDLILTCAEAMAHLQEEHSILVPLHVINWCTICLEIISESIAEHQDLHLLPLLDTDKEGVIETTWPEPWTARRPPNRIMLNSGLFYEHDHRLVIAAPSRQLMQCPECAQVCRNNQAAAHLSMHLNEGFQEKCQMWCLVCGVFTFDTDHYLNPIHAKPTPKGLTMAEDMGQARQVNKKSWERIKQKYSSPASSSLGSTSSLFGMRSVESLSNIPTTASLNKLINRPTVVTDEQKQEEEEERHVSTPNRVKEFSGQWNNITESTSSLLLHQLYPSSRKNSNYNKSLEVLPPISKPSVPQVQFFLSQKQQLQLHQLEQRKVVTSNSTRSDNHQPGTPNGVTAMKEPISNSSTNIVSNGQTSNQSVILPSPNLAATNNNTIKNHQGNNSSNSSMSKMKSPLFTPTTFSSHHPTPTSSNNSFAPLSKSKSQVSLVKPVLISNGPSINSGGHHLPRSSSSANLAGNISGGKNSAMVRSLPQRTAPVQPTIPSQRVHPQTSHQVPTLPKTAAVVFPTERHDRKSCQPATPLKQLDDSRQELIPETRDRPTGLDIDDFLPKHLQNTVRLGTSPPEMSESDAMNDMVRGHRSVATALAHRKKNIQVVLAVWSSKDPMRALDQLEDESVLVDILNVINLKPSFWTLDLCQMLLPSIHELLQSKYESYISVGCTSLKLILKNFSAIITSNITAPPGIGVDISREERYNKCMTCYKHLLSVRAFLLKRQTMQGKLGRSFRELSILMQNSEIV